MEYNNLKSLLVQINRAALKGSNDVRISISDAQKVHTEISLLLLELKEGKKTETLTIDGGQFDA